jgi:acetyl-CoA carboxylase carboxyl transferase subunit alpha
LWRDNNKAELAADSLGITANFLKEKGIIDDVINEPIGGAHRDHNLSIKNVEASLKNTLNEIKNYSKEQLINDRQEKFLKYGRLLK